MTGAPADLLISRRRAALAGLVAPIDPDDARGVEPVAAPIRDIHDPSWRLAADPMLSGDGAAARAHALGRLRPAGRASAAAIALAKRGCCRRWWRWSAPPASCPVPPRRSTRW